MSGHGWVTPNPDGTKARCGGPALCPECAVEAGRQAGMAASAIAALETREASARAALSVVGLHLTWAYGFWVITDKPGDNSETAIHYQSLDDVEAYVAALDHAMFRTPAGKEPAGVRKPKVGDIVHYVSHGTPHRPDGSQAFTSECRAAIVTEVSPEHSSSHGVLTPKAGLCVLNPDGQFFKSGLSHDPGTFRGPPRETTPGEPLPLITCANLEFTPGAWHWAGHAAGL